jgi:PAS domain S-box-containing protein
LARTTLEEFLKHSVTNCTAASREEGENIGRLAVLDKPGFEAVDTPVNTENGSALLSTVPAGSRDKRLALAVILISAVLCVAAVPFVRLPLPKVPAFIPAYEAALVIIDLITAILLFGQFKRSRSQALLTLACGYLFNSLIVIPHALTFPGAFSDTGLLGAGNQSTAWLYVFWHGGFPLSVLGYALLRDRRVADKKLHDDVRLTVISPVIYVAATVGAFTLLATWGMDYLPVLIEAGNFSRLISTGTSPSLLILSLVALIALWRLRQPTVLEIWLMVVMTGWIFDVILSAVISSSRYDLGWYAGRSYGLLAATFVLAVLLLETNSLHDRLAKAQALLREHTEQELLRTRAFLDQIIESIPAMLLVRDTQDGKCVFLNRAGEELLGCDRREVIGKNANDVMPIDNVHDVMPMNKAAPTRNQDSRASSAPKLYEHTLTTRSRGTRWVRTTRVPMRDEHGRVKYFLRFTQDITDQKQIDDLQAQKKQTFTEPDL